MTMIFTDGASRGNPGPGGWGVIILTDDTAVELGGREEETTNNRMEMTAVLETLKVASLEYTAKKLTIYTDSKYTLNGLTDWIHRPGWICSHKNSDIWTEILHYSSPANAEVNVVWVKGHNGDEGNELADSIANEEAKLALCGKT